MHPGGSRRASCTLRNRVPAATAGAQSARASQFQTGDGSGEDTDAGARDDKFRLREASWPRRPGAELTLPGDRREAASGTPGLLQGPSSSWVGSCGLLSWELWRWGPSEMEELQALPLGVLEVGCAPGRRAAISPGGAGDRVPLLRLLPPVGRMLRFSSCVNHWRRSSLPGRLPLC